MSIALLLVINFLTGAFLCNAIPHLVAGLQGRRFPTPFAAPPGRGLSPPPVNFGWGFANLVVGSALLQWRPVGWMFGPSFLCFLAGVLVMGVLLAVHFGRVTGSHES